ncbi:hypothetical protein TPR58_22205 [Sphingomonas sp. HF-S3]|uniref:Uncharacterized protein n=1 Tax=Sphingomonas rustica TaxID=3103142 RepID=A0ABV0BF78_9SPHN
MKIRPAPAAALLLALTALLPAPAAAQPALRRAADEPATAFAARVLGQPEDELQVVETVWNGTPAVFADHLVRQITDKGYKIETRRIVLLSRSADGSWRRIAVTDAEEEGGTAEVAAIGFANADRDADRELIVLLKWPQVHYDYGGAFYEVRLFDTPRPGQAALTYLAGPSRIFGGIGCECSRRDGSATTFRFKTIALIKRELTRRGY